MEDLFQSELHRGDRDALRASRDADITELSRDQQTKALLGGTNRRLDPAKAFEAAWHAANIWLKMQGVANTGASVRVR